MLHILLIILKIIGIVLLVLLGLVLFLVLVVLFVPIRYRASGSKQADVIQGQAGISWLLHLVSVKVFYREKTVDYKIRILGIDVLKLLTHKEKNEKQSTNTAAQKSSKTQPISEKTTRKKESTVSETEDADMDKTVEPKPEVPEIQLVIDEKKNAERLLQEAPYPEKSEKEGFLKKMIRVIRLVAHTIWNTIRRLISIPGRIWHTIKKTALTIQTICAKISKWKLFLTDRKTKAALVHIRHEIFLLLKHVRPRKLKGYAEFGLEDPCQTGEILAALSAFYPLYGSHIRFNPQFDRVVLNGDLALRGRIYVFVLLRIAWQVYRDKNVKFVIHNFQQKEE